MKELKIPKEIKNDPQALQILSAFFVVDENLQARLKAVIDYTIADSDHWGFVLGSLAKSISKGSVRKGQNEEQVLAEIRGSFLDCLGEELKSDEIRFIKEKGL